MSGNSKQQFLDSAAKKNVLGAYLIVCSRGEIAKKLSGEFLRNLYCKKGGCGVCSDCSKVGEGHIDIMHLSTPKVDDIRGAISFVAQKAVDSAYKTVVIEGADDMNASASNSLLKTLEEPPHGSVIILLARSGSGVLPTITSRCAVLHLSPDEDAEQKIVQKLGVNQTTAHILADLSGGFVDEAIRIFENDQLLGLRDKALDMCEKLLGQKNYAVSAYADFLESAKDDVIFVLTVMQSYYHDISMLQKTNNMALIANADRNGSIQKNADSFTTAQISNIIKVILEAERRFSFPVNFRLAAEKMLFDILKEKI